MLRKGVFSLAVLLISATVFAQVPDKTTKAAVQPWELQVTHKGASATPYITLKATNTPARDVMRDIASKAGARVLFSPSASGLLTVNLDSATVEESMTALAAAASLSVRRITLPEAQAGSLTAETAGRLLEALAALPVNATVTDTAGGRHFTIKSGTDNTEPGEGMANVYYIQGKLSPEQERIAAIQRTAKTEPTQAGSVAGTTSIMTKAFDSFKNLPTDQKMQVMRDFQRQFRDSFTPEEMRQMRFFMEQRGGRGDRRGR